MALKCLLVKSRTWLGVTLTWLSQRQKETQWVLCASCLLQEVTETHCPAKEGDVAWRKAFQEWMVWVHFSGCWRLLLAT